MSVPKNPAALVVFCHGSGSSRFSRRNRAVADALIEGGLATLMLDLLTPEEEAVDRDTREHRFNIELLGRRVIAATDWTQQQPVLHGLPVALFGASTGAAAALIAAAARPGIVRAVVSRGGRPDLAGGALPFVQAPTLLIVGGNDEGVIDLNRDAMRHMRARVNLEIVPGATHLFEDPGALDKVAQLSADWCRLRLRETAERQNPA
ncbi:MAG: dienelactone hydrolase family protein [Betaproteobacteria bacterium]